tara:strand:+ start:31440 stop:33197 length:1758 start_codon:yes stop_codon:yes gene_type:complete
VVSIFQKKLFSGIVAVALPTLVLLSGLYELFPVPGWVDPMIYVGYFLDPAEQVWRYGPLYYSGRVPYIFIGHAIHSVFSPVFAHYAMMHFFNGLALGAVFLAAYRLYGRNVAIFSTWWLGLNPLWVNAISTGYVDGPAMAFGLVAFAFAVYGATQARLASAIASYVAAGFFVSLATIIHPVPGGLAALAVLATTITLKGARSAIRDTVYVTLGGVIGVAICTIYALQLGAPTVFSFFSQGPMAGLSTHNVSLFAVPFSEWVPGSYWAIAPLLLLCLAALAIRKTGKKAKPIVIVGALCLATTFTFLLLWDTIIGGVTLQEHFYVSYLIYGEAILVVSILGSLQQSLSVGGQKEVGLFLVVAAASVAPLICLYLLSGSNNYLDFPILWFGLAALGGGTLYLFQTQRQAAAISGVMALTIVSGILNTGTKTNFADSNHPSYKLVFEEVVAIRQSVDLTYLHGRNVFFWGNRRLGLTAKDPEKRERLAYTMSYAGKQTRFNAMDSLAALWVWDRGALSFDMPTLQKEDVERLKRSVNVGSLVIVCLRPQDCDLGVDALKRAELTTTMRASSLIWIPGLEPVRVLVLDF